jgi:hypothetical protein
MKKLLVSVIAALIFGGWAWDGTADAYMDDVDSGSGGVAYVVSCGYVDWQLLCGLWVCENGECRHIPGWSY